MKGGMGEGISRALRPEPFSTFHPSTFHPFAECHGNLIARVTLCEPFLLPQPGMKHD